MNAVKSSVQRSIRSKLQASYPAVERILLFSSAGEGKKALNLVQYKCTEKRNVFCQGSAVILFTVNAYDDVYFPTLRLVHQYPALLPALYVDSGALTHLLQGANVMAPGLFKIVDPDHPIPKDLVVGDVVAIYCHGKEHALAIGKMLMNSNDLTPATKGHAIEMIHYLGDGLWHFIPTAKDLSDDE